MYLKTTCASSTSTKVAFGTYCFVVAQGLLEMEICFRSKQKFSGAYCEAKILYLNYSKCIQPCHLQETIGRKLVT